MISQRQTLNTPNIIGIINAYQSIDRSINQLINQWENKKRQKLKVKHATQQEHLKTGTHVCAFVNKMNYFAKAKSPHLHVVLPKRIERLPTSGVDEISVVLNLAIPLCYNWTPNNSNLQAAIFYFFLKYNFEWITSHLFWNDFFLESLNNYQIPTLNMQGTIQFIQLSMCNSETW